MDSLLQASGQALGGLSGLILPMGAIFLIFYFLVLRPQSKRRKDTEAFIGALKKGDKVVTVGGMHGVITAVRDDTITLKVDDVTKIELNKTAVSPPAAPSTRGGSATAAK